MTFLAGTMQWSLCLMMLLFVVVPMEGAPEEYTKCCDCQTLRPNNVKNNAKPQSSTSPFVIRLGNSKYRANDTVEVTLTTTTGQTFRSFMLVAYREGSTSTKSLGRFALLSKTASGYLVNPDYIVTKDCYNKDDPMKDFAVVSHSKDPMTTLKFQWMPLQNYGNIQFRATFVHNDTTFWGPVASKVLYDRKEVYIPPISTQQCGKSKGCYRVPEDCSGPQCLYVLTWTSKGDTIDFELGGLTGGDDNSYVAAALSEDKYVGDGDKVFVCAHNNVVDQTGVYVGEHDDDYKTKIKPKYGNTKQADGTYDVLPSEILKDEGVFYKDFIQCRFTVGSRMGRTKSHVILSRGIASDGKPERMGVGYSDFPHASADEVLLGSVKDYSGKARYPLVKAHGCIMIVAWILFSSVGFLLAKYYQPMWPEKRVYSRKYWFTGHFKCMSMVFILVVIAIILIFIEADGYTYARDLPYKAHPILGIIIFVCVFLLPFIALLRPGKGHSCRNVFNWLYWIFATIANVLAIPNIFIGMNFGKSAVPWWATWILVFWVIFHIIVEITLEIHQCMTHKKNKERRKKHELLKRDYPKQHHPMPEPAGRRFKRFMLMLHLAITILITLIMVIIIAVA